MTNKILILAETHGATLKPAAAHLVTAAGKIGGDIDIAIMGTALTEAGAHAAQIAGVRSVIICDDPSLAHHGAENCAATLAALVKEGNYTHVLAPASTFGKNILPRAAALMDVQPIADVIDVVSADTFCRPIYAGNAIAKVQSSDPIKMMTVRPSAFARADERDNAAPILAVPLTAAPGPVSAFVALSEQKSTRPDLTAARVVVSGGRGVGSAENFKLIEGLADKLGGAVGASRAAVDAGYAPNDYQVGQTGKIVAPDLYIAAGISGAIQHLAGMKGSKVIVAINKDPDAPIFAVADYGLVADLFQAVPEITGKI